MGHNALCWIYALVVGFEKIIVVGFQVFCWKELHEFRRFVRNIRVTRGGVLRSKGLKDATCVDWFGDDWDCSVGSPPEAMDHVSSSVPIGYAV